MHTVYCALSHTCSKYKNSLIFLKPESQTVPTPLAEHPTDGQSHVVVVVDESAGGQKEGEVVRASEASWSLPQS